MEQKTPLKKPEWFKVKANTGTVNLEVENILRKYNLHTVCEEAGCPNCGECFGKRTATFMILGRMCTRNCFFCNVNHGTPQAVDAGEPENIAKAVRLLDLSHVVITSVTRDDLADGGADHFAKVICSIRSEFKQKCPIIEVLIPDLGGDEHALARVMEAGPDILNHNVETIARLYSTVRPQAEYHRSLLLLERAKKKDPSILTKSGIMVGLGEQFDEVLEVMRDLAGVGCDILTVGQYLAPSRQHHPVVEYIHPDVFAEYKKQGEALGIGYVASAPLVRSSYHAKEAFDFVNRSK